MWHTFVLLGVFALSLTFHPLPEDTMIMNAIFVLKLRNLAEMLGFCQATTAATAHAGVGGVRRRAGRRITLHVIPMARQVIRMPAQVIRLPQRWGGGG